MIRLLFWRVSTLLLTMVAVSFIVYGVLEVNSGEVAVKVLGQFSTEDQRRIWLHEHGYDLPFLVRYVVWLARFASLDWGVSTHYRTEVLPLVMDRLGRTALLGGLTLLVMVPVAFLFGVLAGVREGSPTDRVISFVAVLTTSIPEFASAVLLSVVFVFFLHWLPGASTMTGGFNLREIVLPVLVLALYSGGYLARITRASVAETMSAPYIRTAMLKGASPARIVFRHALRNALIAPVTVVMLQIPWLLSGVIVTEVSFAYKGFGSLLYEAALLSDVPVIEACAMLSVVLVVGTQLISDGLYAALSPRASAGRGAPEPAPEPAPASLPGAAGSVAAAE